MKNTRLRRPLPLKASALVLTSLSLWSSAEAVDKYWGNWATDFNATADWLGALPGVADRAFFSNPTVMPVTTGGSASVLSLAFLSPGITISGTGSITVNSNITNTNIGTGVFSTTAGLTEIGVPMVLGGASGNVGFYSVMGGEIKVSGDISGVRGLSRLGFGVITLSGNNSFAGGVAAVGANGRSGLFRLNINSDTALGTGALSVGTGNGGSTVGNTSGSAHTLNNAVTISTASGSSTNWDLPADGSGDLTFSQAATLSATGGHTCNVIGGKLTFGAGLAGPANFSKSGSGTLVIRGPITNTGTFTFNSGGTMVIDMLTAAGGFSVTTIPMALNNSSFTLKGAPTGSSAQTLAATSFAGRSGISVDGNGGTATTLTIGSTWSRGAGVTLAINLAGNATLISSPALSTGGLVVGSTAAYATVKDSGGVGFATVSTGNVVRYTAAATLATTDVGSTTNYVTKVGDAGYGGGDTIMLTTGNRAYNTLQLDTSGGAGILDLNGITLSITDRAILATGANDFKIQNGTIGASGAELVIHQFSSGTLTINSALSASNGSVTKDGPGTLVIGAANAYTGSTTINEGTAKITGSVKGITATGASVANSGTVSLDAGSAVVTGTVSAIGAGTVNQTVTNAISGAALVSLNGFASTVNLSFANNYSGTTTLTAGTLNLGNAAGIGTGTLTLAGGSLDNTSGTAMTLANSNVVNITGNFNFIGTKSLSLGAGALGLGTAVRNIGVLANTLTFDAVVGGAGGGILKFGAGTLVLNNANTYTGATTVEGGLMVLNNATALPGGIGSSGGSANLTLQLGGVLGLGAGNFTRPLGITATDVQIIGDGGGFAAFNANRSVNLGGASATLSWGTTTFLPNSNGAGSSILVLGHSAATHTLDFQNPIDLLNTTGTVFRTVQVDDGAAAIDAKISGVITRSAGTSAGLAKAGAGTLELSANNVFNGATSVAAGKLIVSGEIFGTSGVNVAGGATLAGGGDIVTAGNGSIVLFPGALLEPGNGDTNSFEAVLGTGQFNISGAASGTGSFKFELGISSDLVTITTGSLNIGSGVLNLDDFAFSDSGSFGAGIYLLFDTSASVVGSLGSNLTGLVNGLPATLSINGGQDVILTVVPEPNAVLMLLSGFGAMVTLRRRRI